MGLLRFPSFPQCRQFLLVSFVFFSSAHRAFRSSLLFPLSLASHVEGVARTIPRTLVWTTDLSLCSLSSLFNAPSFTLNFSTRFVSARTRVPVLFLLICISSSILREQSRSRLKDGRTKTLRRSTMLVRHPIEFLKFINTYSQHASIELPSNTVLSNPSCPPLFLEEHHAIPAFFYHVQ